MSAAERSQAGFRLSIDHSLCSGTGHCQETAPEAFQVSGRLARPADDLDLATADHDRLRRAVDTCPWFAIAFASDTDTDTDSKK